VDDLLAIKGIGPKKLDKMRKYLAVNKPPQSTKPAPAATTQSKSPPAKNPPPKPATKTKPPVAPSASEEEEP
jgi:hypothetical protein